MDDLTIDREFDELCPALTDEEERMLEESILADGCLHPIVTWANHDDTILDGHNRYRLCRLHDRPYKTKALKIDAREEAIAWILRTQLGRRNLNESQRAMLAAKMATLGQGVSRKSMPTNDLESKPANLPVSTQAEAAEQFGVSERTVRSASKVLEDGSRALQRAVESGDVPVSTAAVVATLPKAEQAKVVAKGPEAVKEKAREVKQHKDTFDPAEIEKKHAAKNGSEKATQFKDGTIDELFAKLIKAIDDRWNKTGGHGNKYRICVNAMRSAFDAWKDWKKS